MEKVKYVKAKENIVCSPCTMCKTDDCIYKDSYKENINELTNQLDNFSIVGISHLELKCRFFTERR